MVFSSLSSLLAESFGCGVILDIIIPPYLNCVHKIFFPISVKKLIGSLIKNSNEDRAYLRLDSLFNIYIEFLSCPKSREVIFFIL